MVFHAIWTANVRHGTNSNAFAELRPITVLALASALRMPYESVRRYAETLRKEGLCTRQVVGGLTINPTFLTDAPGRTELVRANIASFLEFLADLRQAGFDFGPYARPGQGSAAEGTTALGHGILHVCSEFVMRTTEVLAQAHADDFIAALIHTSLYVTNLRELFKASPRPAGDALLPPQERLRPVSVRTLAQRIGLPFETVRRHCARMRADTEFPHDRQEGLVVVLDPSLGGSCGEDVRRISFDVQRLMGDLNRTGLNLNDF